MAVHLLFLRVVQMAGTTLIFFRTAVEKGRQAAVGVFNTERPFREPIAGGLRPGFQKKHKIRHILRSRRAQISIRLNKRHQGGSVFKASLQLCREVLPRGGAVQTGQRFDHARQTFAGKIHRAASRHGNSNGFR